MRCWLVEREYDDAGLLRLVYATPAGDRCLVRQRAAVAVDTVTAAIDVDPARLEPVEDDDLRDRYTAEVERVRASHEPTDPI